MLEAMGLFSDVFDSLMDFVMRLYGGRLFD